MKPKYFIILLIIFAVCFLTFIKTEKKDMGFYKGNIEVGTYVYEYNRTTTEKKLRLKLEEAYEKAWSNKDGEHRTIAFTKTISSEFLKKAREYNNENFYIDGKTLYYVIVGNDKETLLFNKNPNDPDFDYTKNMLNYKNVEEGLLTLKPISYSSLKEISYLGEHYYRYFQEALTKARENKAGAWKYINSKGTNSN